MSETPTIQIIDRRNGFFVAEVNGSDIKAWMQAGRVISLLAREARVNALTFTMVLPEGHTIPMIGA